MKSTRRLLANAGVAMSCMLFMAACGACEQGGDGASGSAETAGWLPQISSAADIEALFEADGCLFLSGDGGQLGCLDTELDMGSASIWFAILDTSTGRELERFTLYEGGSNAYEADKVDRDQHAAAEAFLTAGGFSREGEPLGAEALEAQVVGTSLEIDARGRRFTGTLPALGEDDRIPGFVGSLADCAQWVAGDSAVFAEQGIVVAKVWLQTDWRDDPADEGHPCFVPSPASPGATNEETVPPRTAIVVLRSSN